MEMEKTNKKNFQKNIVPQWLEKAKNNNRLVKLN